MPTFTKNLDDIAALLGTSAFAVEEGSDFEPYFGGRFDADQRWVRDADQARRGGVPLWALPVRVAQWKAAIGSLRRADERLIVPSPTKPSVADLADHLQLFGGDDR